MATSPSVGIGPFLEGDVWDSYVERLEMFFIATDITEEEKNKTFFLASVAKET